MEKLQVRHIPQVPGQGITIPVDTVANGVLILNALADYDLYLLENEIREDYSNAQFLEMFDPTDKIDSPDGSWVDWFPESYLDSLENDN